MNSNASIGGQRDVPSNQQLTRQSRRLSWLALLSSGTLLCCCIPTVVLNIAFGPTNAFDPAKVTEIGHEIIPIVVPKDFVGTESLSATNSLFQFRVVKFIQKKGRGKLVLGQYRSVHEMYRGEAGISIFGADYDSQRVQTLVDQMSRGLRTLNVKNRVEHEILIDGKKVVIEVLDGVDIASTTRIRQVSGKWTASGSTCQLMLQAETEFLTDDDIQTLIRSLSDPAKIE